ncbi:signal transduction histidine kinase [Salinibacter ruber]|nr:signal transduction histidine kinase [Salinibacter ruber]
MSTLLYAVRHRRYRAWRRAETLHEQVAQLERAKSRFFADLSHEFRTPLTLILGPLRQALGKQGDEIPGPLRERLGAGGPPGPPDGTARGSAVRPRPV